MIPSSTAAANKRSCASRDRSDQIFNAACPSSEVNCSSSVSGDATDNEPSGDPASSARSSRPVSGTERGPGSV